MRATMAASPASEPGLVLRRYDGSYGGHAHDHFQVLVGLEGVLELEIEGRGRRLRPGEGWVVAPGDTHDFGSRDGSLCLVLDTRQPLWERRLGRAAAAPQFGALAQYLAHSLGQHTPPLLALQHGPALLLEAWGANDRPAAGSARRRIDWIALAGWARARMHLPLTVADLAAQALLSPSQFAQRCREEQGTSPMHWLRVQRLHQARLLREGGLDVAAVARRTGYRSPSALTAALRRAR